MKKAGWLLLALWPIGLGALDWGVLNGYVGITIFLTAIALSCVVGAFGLTHGMTGKKMEDAMASLPLAATFFVLDVVMAIAVACMKTCL